MRPDSVLLVDVGNTNLKWARWETDEVGPVLTSPHQEGPLDGLLDTCWGSDPAPQRILVSNVAGARVADGLIRWSAAHWGVAPAFVRSVLSLLGVTNGYRDPSRLGVDRLLAMGAVRQHWKRSACIVDVGTAITLDALDGKGLHLGGLILPGFDMMRWALERRTAIPEMGEPRGLELLARDTASAVGSGAVHAVAALIDRIMDRLDSDSGIPLLVLSGSAAASLVPALDRPFEPTENLVMAGLALVAADREDW